MTINQQMQILGYSYNTVSRMKRENVSKYRYLKFIGKENYIKAFTYYNSEVTKMKNYIIEYIYDNYKDLLAFIKEIVHLTHYKHALSCCASFRNNLYSNVEGLTNFKFFKNLRNIYKYLKGIKKG